MRRLYFMLFAVCICVLASAQNKKIETFDKNTWRWAEGVDKYQSITIDEGFLKIANLQSNRKASDYQNKAKTFARLPFRPTDNFKLTIKYLVPDYNNANYQILFNTDKKCLTDDEETGEFETYHLDMEGPEWTLFMGEYGQESDKLPGRVKSKGEYEMTLVVEKKSKNVTVELNGIELYKGELTITNSCVGFIVPLEDKKNSYIKVDEIVIEQVERED